MMTRTEMKGTIFIAFDEAHPVGEDPDHQGAGGQTEQVVGSGQRPEGRGADGGRGQVRDHCARRTSRARREECAGPDEDELQCARSWPQSLWAAARETAMRRPARSSTSGSGGDASRSVTCRR